MPLAALIIVEQAEDAGAAPAPTLFGQSLAEFQARIAHRHGAGHIVILSERMPGTLVHALDRLRADGIMAQIVRNAREAADHIHPDEQVLVLAGPVVPDAEMAAAMAHAPQPTLLTCAPLPETDIAMRIDGDENWAGLARIDGSLLRETVAMLGEWDLTPTLLRRAVQSGALRVRLEEGEALVPITSATAALDRAQDLLSFMPSSGTQSVGARSLSWLGQRLAPQLVRFPVLMPAVDPAPLVSGAAGLIAALAGWSGTGLSLMLIAALLASVGQPLSLLPIGRFKGLGLYHRVARWASAAALVAAGWHASTPGALILALWAASLMRPHAPLRAWHADPASMTMLTLIGHGAGDIRFGLGLAIAHALASRIDSERGRSALASN